MVNSFETSQLKVSVIYQLLFHHNENILFFFTNEQIIGVGEGGPPLPAWNFRANLKINVF